jgi:hypothetical protein
MGDQPNTSQEKYRKTRIKYIKANKHKTNIPTPSHHISTTYKRPDSSR